MTEDPLFSVRDRVVLVTGASGGVGGALARAFAERGAHLVLAGRSAELEATAADCAREAAAEPLTFQGDLCSEEAQDRLVRSVEERFGRLDVLINSVGVNVRKKLDEYTASEWDTILGVNLRSVFLLTQRVARLMKRQGRGKVVNIGSIQGVVCWGIPGRFIQAPYCASKAGLISLTRSFALELAAHGVHVNALCPAVVDGRWAQALKDDPEVLADILRRVPLGRLVRHEELVGPALFLSSEASSYVTGHALMVDGGWTIP